MSNFKYNLKNNKKKYLTVFIFVFSLIFYQVANATVYAPGATLEPDCAPGSPSCGVSTPAITNIGNTNLTLDANRLLTLDGFTLTFEGTSFDIVINDDGDISIGGGDISTPSSGLTLSANALSSGTIQIGTGGAGSATPDLFTLDVKSTAGDPAGTNGAMYYNASTNKLRCFESGAWGDCIFQSTSSAQDLTLARIGSSTFSTLQDLQNVFHSAGYTSGGAITDAGGETIDIAAGTGLIRSSNTATATISYFDWDAVSGVAIPTDTIRYVGLEYNGGSPQISIRTSANWNLKTDFSLGVVVNEGGNLTIFSDKQAVGDHAANMVQRDYETMPVEPDVRNGGLDFNETGTRNITLTAGAVWDRLNRYTVPALNTSITGDFDAYYMDGSGGFIKVPGLTQWPNTQYDDMDGTLATMTDNYYAVLWFYLDTNAKVSMVYGMDEYSTAGLAEAEMSPTVDMLPDRLKVFGKLLGKIVFQKGTGTATNVESLISMSSGSMGSITSHASLTDLDFASSGHTGFADALVGVNSNITSMTGITSITPSAGLTITGAGASTWSTSAGALDIDSATALNLGVTNATSVNLGKIGITTTNAGNFTLNGNLVTPKGADYATTGSQNDVNLGVGYTFDYHGLGVATFTGLTGGADGRQIVIHNHSAFNLTLTNQDTNSLDANRIITTTGGSIVVPPNVTVSLEYDGGDSKWQVTNLTATSATISGFAFVNGGNSFATTATLGTTDANPINFITSGSTRFSLASGAATLTGTGATTLASNAGSALNLTSGTTGALNLDSGSTGAVNVGTNANAKTVTIGNIIGATAVNVNTGTGGTTYTTTDGVFSLNTGTGAINLGTDAVAKNITLGNVTGATALNLNAGSGGVNLISSSGLSLNPFDTGAGDTTEIRFTELVASGANYVGFKSPDLLGGNVIWTLPDADGTPSQVLTTDGFGVLSWASAGACPTCVVNNTKFNVDAPTGNITEINDVTTSFPSVQGGSGDVLTNDGAGNLTWSPTGAGSAALSSVSAATGNATIGNGNNNINWNWVLSGATNGLNISETSASSGTGYLQRVATLATSTAKPFSLGARGTTIFDTTATGGLTLGDSATLNTPITLQSGSGAINIGTDAVAKTITLGNTTGATAVNLNSGSGGINFGGSTAVTGSNTFATGTGTTTVNSTLVTLAGNSTVLNMTGTGTLGLNTTTNRDITTGTGLFTAGGDLTVAGNSIQTGNLATPKGTDYSTTGSQNDVDLGTGSLFRYTGAGTATFTGITGGTDGKQIRIMNVSGSDLVLTNNDSASAVANRIMTTAGGNLTVPSQVSVGLQYDSGSSKWRVVVLPATSGTVSGFAFIQSGNAFGATATLGTTDANGLNLITGGATRFSIAAGAPTLTGTGSTILTSTGSSRLDATTGLSLGTSTATSVAIGATGVTTTNNGSLTSTQTLTASNGLTLTTGALNLTATSGTLTLGSAVLAGASPLVFDGATPNANTTTFAITDPSGTRTITFPDASITVNAAANISGTTLASNVVTSSLTATGALSSGSIASGFGSIATTNNITTSANISTTGTGTTTSAGTLTASNGFTMTTGALNLTATSGALTLSGLSASSVNTGANNITFTSGNFNTTATGINNTAVGATTASTGAFTTLSSTGATNIATSGASNVTIATTGTGNVTIGNATGTFAIASSGGLNLTTGGALTGVASIDTIATSATALTFAGTGTISSTGANAFTIEGGSSGALNINNTSTGNILIGGGSGSTGCTITNSTGALACAGAITGSNFSGTNTGDQTTITGNAGTATALQTARTIGGVSFDGTANITVASATGAFAVTGALAANGGITFDSATDTVGAFTSAGTVDMSTNILTNIGNTGTDFVASTGALTLAGVLTANGGISIAANSISGTTGLIDYTNFDVNASGNVDVGGTLTAGSGNEVITLSTGKIDADALTLTAAVDGGTGTSSGSGLEARSDGIGLLQGCTDTQVLKWVESTDTWDCGSSQYSKFTSVAYTNVLNDTANTADQAATDVDVTASTSATATQVLLGYDLVFTAQSGGDAWQAHVMPNGTAQSADNIIGMIEDNDQTGAPFVDDGGQVIVSLDAGQIFDYSLDELIDGGTVTFRLGVLGYWSPVTTGADLAEYYYATDDSINPGDVVSLDPNYVGGIKKSSGRDDEMVIGVISTEPGMVLGDVPTPGAGVQKLTEEEAEKFIDQRPLPVALVGRVPVNVSIENGPIVAGDYLTPSSTPGVAMKASGAGPVIGQALFGHDKEEIGAVMMFVKNFDFGPLGGIGEVAVLLGDVSPLANADGTDNGLSTLISTIQTEAASDPVIIIGGKIADGKQFLTDFVSARVTAIRGYFDEVFAKKVHTDQICAKKSDGTEVCIGGDQLDALLNNAGINSIPTPEPEPDPTPAPDTENEPSPEPEPNLEPLVPSEVEGEPTPTPEPDPEPIILEEEPVAEEVTPEQVPEETPPTESLELAPTE